MSEQSIEIDGTWRWRDYLGAILCRLGFRRNKYSVEPGLYSIGTPDKSSPLLVTANYKLTFNHLRRAIAGRNLWIVVLDTKGVNVWCAAGKGTFGTEELITRLKIIGAERIIDHKIIVLPQLSAPGVCASEVKKRSGFSVEFGPVEAADLPDYLDAGYKANEKMRTKYFPLKERLAVSLTHFSQGLLFALGLSVLLGAGDILLLKGDGLRIGRMLLANVLLSFSALVAGSLGAGALLPVLPGRAFSVKGLSAGLLYSLVSLLLLVESFMLPGLLYNGGKILLLLAFVIFQVLNLTGSSTYTSLSGVQKEMAVTIPALSVASLTALGMIVAGGILI